MYISSTGTMIKRSASNKGGDVSIPQIRKATLSSLTVYELHKRLINDYMVNYHGKTTVLKRNT
jgi:hypothetical protein